VEVVVPIVDGGFVSFLFQKGPQALDPHGRLAKAVLARMRVRGEQKNVLDAVFWVKVGIGKWEWGVCDKNECDKKDVECRGTINGSVYSCRWYFM
jgi:hypothetical protein